MKRKIYLELGITLIVGFLIGFFVNSILTDKRIKDFSMHKGEWSFWRRALTEIKATEEQKEMIIPIIKFYSEETHTILHKSWEQIPPIWEEMNTEIMQYLSKEQQEQIKILKENREEKMRENIKKGSRERHEPNQRFGAERRKSEQKEKQKGPLSSEKE